MNQDSTSLNRARAGVAGRGRLRICATGGALLLLIGVGACVALPSKTGGYAATAVTSQEVVAAAQFAVAAQAKVLQQDAPSTRLELVSIGRAERQVVAGMNYRMRLKVRHDGAEKDAEAVVWWQAWNQQEPYRLTDWNWK